MATLHWEMRGMLKEMREEGRLAVLTALILHANIRMRCWPSVPLLIDETGWSSASVTAAKVWLIEHGAIVLVPYRKRVDEECRLPRSKHIYQLTGMMNIGGETKPYLYMTPESEQAIKVVLAEISLAEKSVGKNSVGKNKGSSTSKGNSTLKGESTSSSDDDAEIQRPNIFSLYEQCFGVLVPSPMMADELKVIAAEFPNEDWLKDAFKAAALARAKNIKYVRAVLESWQRDGKPVDVTAPKPAAQPAPAPAAPPKNAALEAAIAEELAKLPEVPPADYQPNQPVNIRIATWNAARRNMATDRARTRLGALA
jgi:hypothetical protein